MPGAVKLGRRASAAPTGAPPSPPPEETRADPPGWDLNGNDPLWSLENLDETKHYIWANENENATWGGVTFYEARGYEIVEFRGKEGVHLTYAKMKLGDPIKRHGHVLMAVPLELKERMEAKAQRRHDVLVDSMVDRTKSAIADTLRGIPGNERQGYVQLRRTKISEARPQSAVD